MHFFSVCLITPAYFAKFFGDDGRLNLEGRTRTGRGDHHPLGVGLPRHLNTADDAKSVGGVRWKRSQRMGYLSLVLVAAHMVVFGLKGWISPHEWPWSLPPISLLAAAVAIVPLIDKLRRSAHS